MSTNPAKRLLTKSIYAAVPWIVFLLLFDWRVTAIPASSLAAKRELFARQRSRIETLVLGSSHAVAGVLPSLLGPKTFNWSGVSQTLYYDHALLAKYIGEMPSLRLVILPISYFSLECEALDDSPEGWRTYLYRYDLGLPHQNWHLSSDASNYFAYFLYGGRLGRVNILRGRISDVRSDYDLLGGWINRPRQQNEEQGPAHTARLREDAVSAVSRHESMMNVVHLAENVAIVEDIERLLKPRKVGLLLVSLPVTQYYSRRMDPVAYKRMQAAIRGLRGEHTAYADHLLDDTFNDLDFADSDHLNYHGALKFSMVLRQGAESIFQAQSR